MMKIYLLFFFFSFISSPILEQYVICNMSKDSVCKCSKEHKNHSCCKIVNIYKDFDIYTKLYQFELNKSFEKIQIFFENLTNFFLQSNKEIKIKSPPLIYITCQLLI